MALSVNKLFEIEELFLSKNWEIEDNPEVFSSLYNRFCSRVSFFTKEEQQSLCIELANRFVRIHFTEYESYFLKAFATINKKIIQNKRICILPLKFENENSIKSGSFIWKYFKDQIDFSDHPVLSNAIFYENIDSIINLKNTNNSYYFLFIDDYLGSGTTALDSLKKLFNSEIVNNTEVGIITFASQIEGAILVETTLNIHVFSGIYLNKGISDNYYGQELLDKTNIMKSMEKKLAISKHNFGYNNSESLITLGKKSPNNTFPVFWHETKTRIAPFPRYRKYSHNGSRN